MKRRKQTEHEYNVIILGSGGCFSTQKTCRNCGVCTETQQKGFPYARTGRSLFVEDVNLLRIYPPTARKGNTDQAEDTAQACHASRSNCLSKVI